MPDFLTSALFRITGPLQPMPVASLARCGREAGQVARVQFDICKPSVVSTVMVVGAVAGYAVNPFEGWKKSRYDLEFRSFVRFTGVRNRNTVPKGIGDVATRLPIDIAAHVAKLKRHDEQQAAKKTERSPARPQPPPAESLHGARFTTSERRPAYQPESVCCGIARQTARSA